MNISFNGVGERVATFVSANETRGVPVKVTANGTVSACSDGDKFCGVALAVRNGMNSVQLGGYLELPYSGTAPGFGPVKLAADGAGGVKTSSSGQECLVVFVGTDTVGFIL